jgi:hypothetical protein
MAMKIFERASEKTGKLIEGFAIWNFGTVWLQINLDGKKHTIALPSDFPKLASDHKFAQGYNDLKVKGFSKLAKDVPILESEYRAWVEATAQVRAEVIASDPLTRINILIDERKNLDSKLQSLFNEIVYRQERQFDDEYLSSFPVDTSDVEPLIRTAQKEIQEFDSLYPEVVAEFQRRTKEEVKCFLEYD